MTTIEHFLEKNHPDILKEIGVKVDETTNN